MVAHVGLKIQCSVMDVSVRLRPGSQIKVSWRNWQHAYGLGPYIERCESSTLSEITKKPSGGMHTQQSKKLPTEML